jgi:sedoheptulokinase
MTHAAQPLYLGLDLGTSKTAAVLAAADGTVLAAVSQPHHAALAAPAGHAEQDPEAHARQVWSVISQLPRPLRQRVAAIGVTGQMHGVLLLDHEARPVSPLVTWQDDRCRAAPDWLPRLAARTGHPLRAGYGCTTLAWLVAQGGAPAQTAAAATLHDWLVARLCGAHRPATDPTDAASWGLYDLATGTWDAAAVAAAGIPAAWLPAVQPCGSLAGHLTRHLAEELHLPPGCPVAVAIGDNQASLLATLRDPEHELALTLGTGGQLSAVLPAGTPLPPATPGCEYRPFPGGRYAAVAAALCGGAAWAWLADSATTWALDLGLTPPPRDALFARLNELGLAADHTLPVSPRFAGERFAPAERGTIGGLPAMGLHLGPLARGLAQGIVANLRDMLPPAVRAGRTHLVGSGNALRRNPLLQHVAAAEFGLPLYLPSASEEAASGAAALAAALAPHPAPPSETPHGPTRP